MQWAKLQGQVGAWWLFQGLCEERNALHAQPPPRCERRFCGDVFFAEGYLLAARGTGAEVWMFEPDC